MKRNLFIICVCLVSTLTFAQDQVFFTEGTDVTFYDQGIVDVANLGSSTFEHAAPPCCPEYNDKIPCSTMAYSGGSSLKFHYASVGSTGAWKATVFRNDWADIDITANNYLTFYLYSTTAMPKEALPKVGMRVRRLDDDSEEDTEYYSIAGFNQDVPANTWVKIGVPLKVIVDGAVPGTFNFTKVKAVVFGQSETNGVERTLYIDDVKTTNETVTGILDTYVSDVQIVPNPIKSIATLTLPAALQNETLQLAIISSTGSEVEKRSISGQQVVRLDMSSYVSGFYFVSLSDGKETIVKKVLKQ
ncbi:MAG: T9SS type A sorting domain-containing protein [Marinilabiliaceae bacterium]|nr:T9SS type A sorting domain-containing protein [Marinilabiliaceae bacterium]